jgi:hypothetical protein
MCNNVSGNKIKNLHVSADNGHHWKVTNTSKETSNLCPHTEEQTQYRGPTVKEHDHHWDSQQDFN